MNLEKLLALALAERDVRAHANRVDDLLTALVSEVSRPKEPTRGILTKSWVPKARDLSWEPIQEIPLIPDGSYCVRRGALEPETAFRVDAEWSKSWRHWDKSEPSHILCRGADPLSLPEYTEIRARPVPTIDQK